ncbi:unnamed protein product, partial [Vitis vinifera]|uniref:Uncharacterized protein n=1 Tax=Vitis vinifera TaxID=29760 RepID=D7SXQ4_VITVI
MTGPDCNASIVLTDKGDLLRASYVNYLKSIKEDFCSSRNHQEVLIKGKHFHSGGIHFWWDDYCKGKAQQ